MKKIPIYLFVLISILACGNDEDISMYNDDSELSSLTMSEVLSSVKFVPDDSIGYVPEGGLTLFSNNSFKRYIQGYGWENVGSYEIFTDGTLAKEDLFKGVDGGGPSHYYFGEGQMREFVATTAYRGTFIYDDEAYQYAEEQRNCVFALYEEGPYKIFPLFHILYYNDETKEMAVLRKGARAADGPATVFYLVQFYQRMSEERLEEIRQQYCHNVKDNDR